MMSVSKSSYQLAQSLGEAASAVEILLRVTLLLLVAVLVALALRRKSAALRHFVWILAIVGTLLIPICYWAFPAWQWAILPQRDPVAVTAVPSIVEVVSDAPPEARVQPAYNPRPLNLLTSEFHGVPPALPASVAEPLAVATPAMSPLAWSWPAVLGILWAVGTSCGLVWLAVGIAAAWYVVRRAQPADDLNWHPLLRQLLAACNLRCRVEVRQCRQVSIPMTWGLHRPVILVPVGSGAWSDEIKRSVLLHELGHIRRGDCLMHLLGRLACVVYWFHPLVWLAARQLRKTSEQAADDAVLASNIAPQDYAEHLVGIAGQMRGLQLFGHVALPMASPSDLEGRVLAILDPQRNRRSLRRMTLCILMVLAAIFLLPCAALRLGYVQAENSPEQVPGVTDQAQGEPQPTNVAPVQEAVGVAGDGAEDAKPVLRQGTSQPAPQELIDKLLDTNRHWLRPDPPYLAYLFSMEHPGRYDKTQVEMEYTAPSLVNIQTVDRPPFVGQVDDSYDPMNSAYPPQRQTLLQGVTLFGPLQELAMSPEGHALSIVGEETIDGAAAWVLHLMVEEKVSEEAVQRWDARLRQQATKNDHFDEERYKKLKAKSHEPEPILPMRVGCGVFGSWYGYSGGGADVAQIWVDKATGRILREEGFLRGKPHFIATYASFETTSDNGQVPRQIAVCLLSDSSDEVYPWVFQMEFQLLDGKVWLLKELKESQGKRQNAAIAAVTNVSLSAANRTQMQSQVSGSGRREPPVAELAEEPATTVTEDEIAKESTNTSVYEAAPVVAQPTSQQPQSSAAQSVSSLGATTLSGRVLDHENKPVKDARVLLPGPGSLLVENGNIVDWGSSVDHQAEGELSVGNDDPSLRRWIGNTRRDIVQTDADGRFRINAAGRDVTHITVLAPRCYVWAVSVPAEEERKEELIVRLPKPATLKVMMDIPGAIQDNEKRPPNKLDNELDVQPTDEAWIHLQLMTSNLKGWRKTDNFIQTRAVANPGEVVFENLPPGLYDFARTKLFTLDDRGQGGFCDRQLNFELASGETKVIGLVRQRGQRVVGEIRGLPEDVPGTWLKIHVATDVTGDWQKLSDDWKLPVFDYLTCENNAQFLTSLLEPGQYMIVAHAYRPKPKTEVFSTGGPLPDFIGTTLVTVEDDNPADVKKPVSFVTIDMKPYEPSTPPSAPPQTSVPIEPPRATLTVVGTVVDPEAVTHHGWS